MLALDTTLIALVGSGALLLLCVVWVVHGLRYKSSRVLMLDGFAWLVGARTQWIDDPVHARLVLQASNDKGLVIERLLATPAWEPLLSLESVDGAQWQRMKRHFLQIVPVLPSNTVLQRIVRRHVEELRTAQTIIDAPAIAQLTISSMYEWLFERPFQAKEWQFVCDATWEWRKEIALRGRGDRVLKNRLVEWLVEQVRDSKYYALFGERWTEPEYFSCIIQPFIVSPAINVCDIAVGVTKIFESPEGRSMPPMDLIYLALQRHNPFPVLERYLPDGLQSDKLTIPPRTQVFITLDDMGRRDLVADPHYRALVFGSGARSCPGKSIALNMMTVLFTHETLSCKTWQPRNGHRYSGRDNDGQEDVSHVTYQVALAIQLVSSLVWQRLTRRKTA